MMYIVKQNKKQQWIIIKKGAKRASKVFGTKAEAIMYAEKNYSNNYIIDEKKMPKSFYKRIVLVLFFVILVLLTIVAILYFTGNLDRFIPQDNTGDTDKDDDSNPSTDLPSTSDQGDSNPSTDNPSTSDQNDNNPETDSPSNPNQGDDHPQTEQPSKPDDSDKPIIYEDFQVHFLELGNYNAGDCTFIKAGDLDILIDAGSTTGSIPTLKKYINQYCKDGVLEYVIATHAHEDHIAGFTTDNGIFASYEVKTIIDFTRKNTTSKVSASYITYRDQEVAGGAKHYTASDCIQGTNGGQRKYQLTENISFEVLDQKYYYSKASSENDYSVCTLFTRGEDHFLFTGDLELSGEESLAELNDLPKVKLYKAGHHGSKTSSNEVLLREIQPEYVAVCCCAGSSEYTGVTDNMFPTQDFINRVAVYTDKIYVTTMCDYTIEIAEANAKGDSKVPGVEVGKEYMKAVSSSFKPMNGNITFTYVEGVFSVSCSNNNTILKDTEWFTRTITLNGITRKMRTWPTASA